MKPALLGLIVLAAVVGPGVGASQAPPPRSAVVRPAVSCSALDGRKIPASAIGLATTGAAVTAATLVAPRGDARTGLDASLA